MNPLHMELDITQNIINFHESKHCFQILQMKISIWHWTITLDSPVSWVRMFDKLIDYHFLTIIVLVKRSHLNFL